MQSKAGHKFSSGISWAMIVEGTNQIQRIIIARELLK